nr:TIGR04388 family protein [Leptospira sp.]
MQTFNRFNVYLSRFYSLSISFFIVSLPIFSQATMYELQMPGYNSEEHLPMYRDRYFSKTYEEWSQSVISYLNIQKNEWEAIADRTIWKVLETVQYSDFYLENEAYLDETFRSLDTQKQRMLAEWEFNASQNFYENEAFFLQKLNTGSIDRAYLDRIYETEYFKSLNDFEKTNYLEQERFVDSYREWEYRLQQTETTGLTDFSNAFTNLQLQYETYMKEVQKTDSYFTQNLSAINQYKNQVKQGISSLVSFFKDGLKKNCEFESGCQYRKGNQELNTA